MGGVVLLKAQDRRQDEKLVRGMMGSRVFGYAVDAELSILAVF
jgi:hypothetical protein